MLTRPKIRRVFVALSILTTFYVSAAYAQEAVGKLDLDRIIAGKSFPFPIHFDTAPSYSNYAIADFTYKRKDDEPISSGGIHTFQCRGDFKSGDRDVVLTCKTTTDNAGGEYYPNILRSGPPPDAASERTEKLSAPGIEVVAVQDTNIYPNTAVGTISLNQEEILESGAFKIESLLDVLNTKLDNNAAETSDLKPFLRSIASDALSELEKSRLAYRKVSKSGNLEPIFFEDFAKHYNQYIYDLDNTQLPAAVSRVPTAPHFQTVQATSNQTITVHPSLGDSLGPLASKLAELLGNHRAAFLRIGKSGALTFTISLHSSPPGASISYKRIGDDYQDYSRATDVEQATFPYALWTFRFRLGKCEVIKTPNPYIEQSPNLSVSMQPCITK